MSTSLLRIPLYDWVRVEPLNIVQGLVRVVGRSAQLAGNVRVEVDAPDLERLLSYVQEQSMSATDAKIAGEQAAAIADAKKSMARLTGLIRELLQGLLPRFSVATAARSCAYFVHASMAQVVVRLGSYQRAASDNVLTQLDEWFDRDAPWPTLIQRRFGAEVAAKIVIARTEYPRPPEPSASIYLPDHLIEPGFPMLRWVSLEDIDPEIWTDVVLPQYVGSAIWDESTWRPWSSFDVLALFEGERWKGALWLG